MSRIKDYLAEVENIDDLKRPFYEELGEMAYDKAKNWEGIFTWFRQNAEYGAGEGDDEGHTEYYFENFMELCEQAITDEVDSIIEDQHLDIDDQTYSKAIEYGTAWLSDLLADFESDCIDDYVQDHKYILDEIRDRNGGSEY